MQTVYVPVKASEEMPDDEKDILVRVNGQPMFQIGRYEDRRGKFLVPNLMGEVFNIESIEWPKPTEAVLLSKEDADRVKELESALRSLLELGRKDFSNQKYDGYFEQAAEALNRGK